MAVNEADSTDSTKQATKAESLAEGLSPHGESLPVVQNHAETQKPANHAETLIPIDNMYETIGRTLHALNTTTVDGENPSGPDSDLQAHTHKSLLPDTEIQMLHQEAVPLSDDDIKAFDEHQKLVHTVQYRQKQLQIPTKTLAEITGSRVKVAYRLARYMAHIRGIGAVGEPLIFSMAAGPQVNLFEIPIPYDPTVGWYRGLAAVRNLLAQADAGYYRYTYSLEGRVLTTRGMSILPPPLHDGYYPQNGHPRWEYRRRQHTPEGYRGDTDAPLAMYLNMCELLVRHLGIGQEDVDEQAAVAALLNPSIARLAWPCRDDIETFEEDVLLPYVGRIVVSKSQDSAIETLKREMGLKHSEAFDIIETYKTYCQHANTYEPERERSVMIGKLDRLAEECSVAGMVTTELNAHKSKLQVLGLTRHEEDTNIDRRASLESVLEAEIVDRAKIVEALPAVEEDGSQTDN